MGATQTTARVGKRPKPHGPGFSYANLVDGRGIELSLHDSHDVAGEFWLVTGTARGDYRPARLDLGGIAALRDACDLVLAEHATPKE